MYEWLVFAHILGVFGFLLAHGASTAVAFKLRGERTVARVQPLLELSRAANQVANICLLLLLVAGIALGFMGAWWGQLWIWVALAVLVAIAVAMLFIGSEPLTRVRRLLETDPKSDLESAASTALVEQRMAELLAATRPWLLTLIGGGGLAIILWLMLFKPF